MKSLLLLIISLFASRCLAAASIEGAHERIYFYLVYEFDIAVWGTGKGFISTECRGSNADESCTFNEFINYIETGSAVNTPTYYDGIPGGLFTIGTIGQIVDALTALNNRWNTDPSRIVIGRKELIGLWKDLGNALDRGVYEAQAKGISVTRHLANAQLVLGEVSRHRAAALNPRVRSHMGSAVKDVLWQIVDKESQRVKWQEIDWEKTVATNPQLLDPSSTTSKKVFTELQNFWKVRENAIDKTVSYKVNDSLRACF
ncbi:hypothetical protein QQX98_006577 [Neonectria punicea]|uniref:Uncharacterized protein n=1 Tax=Neonectria punicea TaxID=979145 RepID=A0ABR1H0C4_9HYPO